MQFFVTACDGAGDEAPPRRAAGVPAELAGWTDHERPD